MPTNIDADGNQISGNAAVWQALTTAVNTQRGRQLRRPDYGIDLLGFIGRTPASAAAAEIREAIEAIVGGASGGVTASVGPDGRIAIDFTLG